MTDWEGGERQGIRWGHVGLAALLLALTAGAVYTAGNRDQLAIDTDNAPVVQSSEVVEVVVVAPLQAGDRWYCPSTHPVSVHDTGEYYPREYPEDHRNPQRPKNCYADVARAEGAGFELAEPPANAVIAGGIYLMPTQAPTRRGCENTADRVGFRAPCPRRLPTPPIGPSCGLDSCVYGDREGIVIEHRTFETPVDWANPAEPNVVITAVGIKRELDADAVEVDGPPELVTCATGMPVVVRTQPEFQQCPETQTWIPRIQGDPHSKHTAAFWRDDEVVYAASVEGHSGAAEQLLHAIIDGVDYVEPPS